MKRRATLVAIAALVLAASPARGVEPLITDRPDFTESPNAVATGVVQFEAGATFVEFAFADGGGRGVLGNMEAGLIVSTTVPTGGAEFSSPAWQPAAVAAAGWDLGSGLGLGVNLGVARPADESDRFTTVWASAALGVGVTDDLSLFFELIGCNREEPRGPNTATIQTGAVNLPSPDLQLDFRVARRLTEHGGDLLVGSGVSWRLGG